MRGLTLPGALDDAAAARPDVTVDFPGSVRPRVTLAELAEASVSAARALVASGVEPGDRVGVLSRNNADFLTAVFAVTRAGAAACPLPLPTSARDLGGYAARVAATTAAAGIRRVLVGAGVEGVARRLDGVLVELTFVAFEELARAARGRGRLPVVAPRDLAVVQFTSGSTAVPKGVALTHRNVVHGTAAIVDGIGLDQDDHGATWLPLFHDMGLFGTLSAVLTGVPMTVWSPSTFVKDPARWLRDFLARGCTVAPSPNFGYDSLLAAVDADQLGDLDLSRWRVALNGAEPVSPTTVERFCAHFGKAGFAESAMFPVYGMAEATLAVAFPPLGRAPVTTWVDRDRLAGDGIAVPADPGDVGARGLVGLGQPVRGMRLRIVDDRRRALPDGLVGEIEIQGDSVTAGYLTGAAAPPGPAAPSGSAAPSGPAVASGSAAAPGPVAPPWAAADGRSPSETWLPTGDLGFRRAGELYVSGRRKEMIIVRGVNYYPEDAEALARDTPGLHRRRCVAVADVDPGGAETITLVAETALATVTDRARLATDLRVAVGSALGLSEVSVRLVPPDALPRTSSGKFRRLAARDLARTETR